MTPPLHFAWGRGDAAPTFAWGRGRSSKLERALANQVFMRWVVCCLKRNFSRR